MVEGVRAPGPRRPTQGGAGFGRKSAAPSSRRHEHLSQEPVVETGTCGGGRFPLEHERALRGLRAAGRVVLRVRRYAPLASGQTPDRLYGPEGADARGVED